MPALKRPDAPVRLQLPPRQALLAGETDVLVVGGGPGGLGAAIAAADAGASVVLAERYGFLGGNATAALVMPLMSFHTQIPTPEKKGATTLLPTDHGPGEAVVKGQAVGTVGISDPDQPPHLHFEIRHAGPGGQPRSVDPASWLRGER